MRFSQPLVEGRLLRRYKRFLADVELAGGEAVTAHCANPGSMLGLDAPGARVWLAPAAGPGRKLAWRWELVEADGVLVGIDTALPNRIVAEAVAAGAVPELAGYDDLRREVRYGRKSRIDILLEGAGRPAAHVEVKSVTLRRRAGLAEFPDSVTLRGARHLEELGEVARRGGRAVMFFLAQRADCTHFDIARDLDPAYDAAFRRARAAGVEALCRCCTIDPGAIELGPALQIA